MILKPRRDAARQSAACSTTTAIAATSARCSSSTTRRTATTPITLAHAGNGFFMRRGYAVAWLAWEGDMLPGDGRMVLDVPVATDNGEPITGRIRVEYHRRRAGHHLLPAQRPDRGAFLCRRLARHARRGADAAALSVRHAGGDPARPMALRQRRGRHRRRDAVGANTPWCRPTGTSHCRPASSPAGSMSSSIRRRIRWCMGLGHVAVRDFVSFLKYDDRDGNPLRGVEKAYAWGRSQTGRCLRDFVYRGYQRRRRGTARVRRRAAACRRCRAEVAEPSLRQPDRLGRPAIRGPLQHRRQLPVLLRRGRPII